MSDPTAWDDAELARRCARGEAEAWRLLVARVGPRIHRLAARLFRGKDPDLLEDAVAEAFAHFLNDGARVLKAYRGEASLETYLAVVAQRRLLARARWRPLVTLSGEALAEAAGPSKDPGGLDRSVQEEEIRRLRAAWAALPERERRLLDLLYREGLTHREAARRLGLPPGTVATWAARAQARLAGEIGSS